MTKVCSNIVFYKIEDISLSHDKVFFYNNIGYIFILLIYWSIIIFAPVISKENRLFKEEFKITLNK